MRQLLVPACLFICAWAQPANPVFEFTPSPSAHNTSIVAKTQLASSAATIIPVSLPVENSAPAETTNEVLTRGETSGSAVDTGNDFESAATQAVQSNIGFDEAGFVAAKLETALA